MDVVLYHRGGILFYIKVRIKNHLALLDAGFITLIVTLIIFIYIKKLLIFSLF